MSRDNFSKRTINLLAERVGFLCSNPACGCHTVGPNRHDEKSTRIGKAAHITAAASGGPRYETALTPAARSDIANGIWLCSNCADLIDKDELAYPGPLLRLWKANAEEKMSKSLKAVYETNAGDPLHGPYLEADLVWRRSMRMPGEFSDKNPGRLENGVFVVDVSGKPIIHWSLGWEMSLVIHNNSSYPAFNVSVEIDSGGINTIERSALPKVNHVQPFGQVKMKITYMEKMESSHVEADERLAQRIPNAFDNAIFKIYYFDEARKRHRTLARVAGQQVHNGKSLMNNPEEPKQIRLKYNGVVVIQSLPDDEVQTGRELYDSIISRRCSLTGKAAYFYNPTTKADFFTALDDVCTNVLYDELMPIIHFELHGNGNGLVMKNAEAVNWESLQEHLRLINRQTRNQLIVTLATCWGSRVWEMIDITQPAPYWGYIGPKESILADVLMEDFTDFYDTLLSTEDLDAAIGRLKTNGTRAQYIYLNCKAIFEYHIERRFQEKPMDKKAAFHRLKGKTKENVPGLNRAERRKQLKESINKLNRPAFIAKIKKVFLMQ